MWMTGRAVSACSYLEEKARSWFNRSVTLNPDLGDHWAGGSSGTCT